MRLRGPTPYSAVWAPTGSVVKMEFPSTADHGDVTLFWYEGKKPNGTPYLPELPEVVDRNEAFPHKDPAKVGQMTEGGWFIVGTEGVLLNKSDQARNPEIWPKKRREEQELRLAGGFAGIAFGWIHLQFSPEVIYYESLDDEHPEQIIQFGTQIRLSL